MLTKRELCERTGIPDTTFSYWLREGLIPKSEGVKAGRGGVAVYPDYAVEVVRMIVSLRGDCKSMAEIKLMIAEYHEVHKSGSAVKHMGKWSDAKLFRSDFFRLIGAVDSGHTVEFMNGGSTDGKLYVYVSVPVGEDVVFCLVDVTNEENIFLSDKKTVEKGLIPFFFMLEHKSWVENGRLTVEDAKTLALLMFQPEFKSILADSFERAKAAKTLYEMAVKFADSVKV